MLISLDGVRQVLLVTPEATHPTLGGQRLIVGCFASHLHRVQQICDIAIGEGGTIFPLGRSMVNV